MENYNIPNCFYRISIKALILDDEKRFLLTKEKDDKWDLPGGGLDFGEKPENCLRREIQEEMGLEVTYISDTPSYFLTSQKEITFGFANIIYLTKIKNLNFTKSDECTEIKFFTKKEAQKEDVISNILDFLKLFNPEKH